MLNLTTKTRYAVRALYHVVSAGEGKAVSVKQIAEKEGISRKYLESIFQSLRRGEIVHGSRGPVGGYTLARPVGEVSLFDVVSAVEAAMTDSSCTCGGDSCVHESSCRARPIWNKLEREMESFLRSIDLSILLTDPSGGSSTDFFKGEGRDE
jgi:Rrf2 family iron-sulfur cluster assembly transcriptional regulator